MTSREDFTATWLFEEPMGTNPVELANEVESVIREKCKVLPDLITDLGDKLKKLELNQLVYYWYEEDGQILLGAEFQKKPQALVVNIVGKYNKGKPPYASDLYDAVLKDRQSIKDTNAIRIMSDDRLSDEGFKIWSRLFALGHKISIYDSTAAGSTYSNIDSVEQMQQYFKKHELKFRRYQYVISESGIAATEVHSFFNLYRVRELSRRATT